MLNIGVCDDNIIELEQTCSLITLYSESRPLVDVSVKSFTSSGAMSKHLDDQNKFNIYLLDILMPEINGITLGRKIRSIDNDGIIIYMTTSKNFALETYSVFAFQYLVKPIETSLFFHVMDKAVMNIRENTAGVICVKTKEAVEAVPYYTIAYAESNKHVVNFYLADGSILTSIHIRTSFESMIQPLLQDTRFLHPHKSFIVNMNYVRKISASEFIMWNDVIIPISRRNYSASKSQYINFISNRDVNKYGAVQPNTNDKP